MPAPVVVLLDLKLPRLDGLEILNRIRADTRTHRMPVVILTSSNDETDLVNGYDAGANSYVRKPIQSEAFAATIAQLGLYWLVLNQPAPPGDEDGDRTAADMRPARRRTAPNPPLDH